jgi:hypothetical protein
MIDLHPEQTKLSGRWVQKGFLALAEPLPWRIAVLFNFCLIAQLLTVGLAVFDDPTWWNIHVLLVRGYGGLVVLLSLPGLAGHRELKATIFIFQKAIDCCFRFDCRSFPTFLKLDFGIILGKHRSQCLIIKSSFELNILSDRFSSLHRRTSIYRLIPTV